MMFVDSDMHFLFLGCCHHYRIAMPLPQATENNIKELGIKGIASAMPPDYFFFRFSKRDKISRMVKTKATSKTMLLTQPETADTYL